MQRNKKLPLLAPVASLSIDSPAMAMLYHHFIRSKTDKNKVDMVETELGFLRRLRKGRQL